MTSTVALQADQTAIQTVADFIAGLPEDEREDAIAIISEALDGGATAEEAIEEFAPQPEEEDTDAEPEPAGKAKARGIMLKLQSAGIDFGVDWTFENDQLVMRNVKVMGMLSQAERPDFGLPPEGIDAAWFGRAVQTFDLLKNKGKLPRLMKRHNEKGIPAEVIGKLDDLRWEEPWLLATVIFTNPDSIGKMARGEFPSRSAEFVRESNWIWGLSLTEGEMGHFEEEIEDLMLKEQDGLAELRRLSTAETPVKGHRISTPLKLKYAGKSREEIAKLFGGGAFTEMDFAPMALVSELMERIALQEQAVQMLMEKVESAEGPGPLDSEIEKAAEEMPPEQAPPVAPEGELPPGEAPAEGEMPPVAAAEEEPVEDEEEQRRLAVAESNELTKLRAEMDALKAEKEKETYISAQVEKLATGNFPLSRDQIRERLEKCGNQNEREAMVSILAAAPIPPMDEPEFTETQVVSLRSEFESRFGTEPADVEGKNRHAKRWANFKLATRRGVNALSS